MKQDLSLSRLEARIELVKRHVTEWKQLLSEQSKARYGAIELLNQLPVNHVDENNPNETRSIESKSTDVLTHLTKRAHQLTLLSIQHSNEQQQMQTRHQQEIDDLESLLSAQGNYLANPDATNTSPTI